MLVFKIIKNIQIYTIFSTVLFVLFMAPNFSFGLDVAIERAKKAQEDIERVGKPLGKAMTSFGKDAAPIARELAKIIAENKEKIDSGMITAEMQENFDAQKINAISRMKTVTDKHLSPMLSKVDAFDDILVTSVSNTRAAVGINKDYEFEFKKQKESIISDISSMVKNQEAIVKDIQENCINKTKSNECQRLKRKFNTINRRINTNKRRIKLAEADLKISQQNQRLAKLIGQEIRTYGSGITENLRMTLSFLYKEYANAQKVAGLMGTGSVSHRIAQLVKDSDAFWSLLLGTTDQTTLVIDNVIGSFDGIQPPDNTGSSGEKQSVEDILRANQEYVNQQSN